MAMASVVPILTTIGGWLVSPITDHLGYMWHYNTNIEDFSNQLERLRHMRDRVQQSVNVTRRNGEEIFTYVEYWLTEVDGIIAQAGELNERIEANERHLNGCYTDWISMYKLSREVKKKSSIFTRLQDDNPGENLSLPAPPLCVDLASNRDFVTTESFKSTMDQIMELLQNDGCDIIGVYGMGGVGKTTLVTKVGKKAKEQKLFAYVVKAVVSQNLNLTKIQDQIADLLGLEFREKSDSGRASRLYGRLKNEDRILIILDDVWAKIDLAKIGIPHGANHKGCKVILTTRRERVCADMGIKRIRMSSLSLEESWNLFREKAGAIVDSSPTLNVVAKDVASECCGLPLALVTVGKALHGKELEEWTSALQQLQNSVPDETELEVFSCIKLSYDYINYYETKLLFLLCCLFPEDYEIAIENLARFGMGRGLFGDADTMDKARFTAHQRIRYLKDSCLLLDGRQKVSVKMHDVVRDVAISIASKDRNISFLVRAGLGFKVWPNMQTFEHYTAISLMENDIKKLPRGLECPNLQILLLGGNKGLEEIPDAFFQGMPELRVLDLSCHQDNPKQCHTILPPSFELLAQLRTLRLDGCKLDSSISVFGKLKKLEILSLTDTDIKELPKEIGELSNLRLLDLTRCQVLQLIPPNVISRLTKLEELCMGGSFQEWAVEGTKEEKRKACLSELKSLPHLLILSVAVKNIECYPRQLLLQNLVKFDVSTGAGSTKLYPTSRRLAIGHIKIALSDGLKVLLKSAEVFDLTEDSMSEIFDVHGGGPIGLKELTLSRCDNMLSLLNSKSSVIFTSLETLNLEYMASMSFICDSSASFTNLRELSIKQCESLKYLFPYSVAESLLQLKSVFINSCEKLERIIEEEDAVEGASSSRLQPTIVFPNLESVDLGNCPQLTSLFPVATEKEIMLPKLKILTIYSCEKLERIIEDEDAEEGASSSRLQPIIVFPNLEVVTLGYCPLLTSLFPVATEKEIMLPKLERLVIKSCEKLERIIEEEDAVEGASSSRLQPIIVFPNLKIVELNDCSSLTSLFPVATEKEIMLPKLKRLRIKSCEKLERIIEEEDAVEGASSSRLQPIIVFPNLEFVDLRNCPQLTSLFPVATEKEIMLPKLKILTIYSCEKLERIIEEEDAVEGASSSRLQPIIVFPNLEFVGLRNCPLFTSLFPVATEKEIMLPKLKSVWIESCEKLERIIEEEDAVEGASSSRLQPTIVFPNLESVDLRNCPLLTSLFPVATEKEIVLPKLKSVWIDSCEKLERIIEEEDAVEGASSSRLQPTIVFPNLESVDLGNCPQLTSLFPVATEKEIMLPKLKILTIYSCEKLERIIEEEDAVEGASSSRLQPIIVFPNLEEVKLNDCPSLTSIFPVATEKEIMLPKLKSLTIYSCEKLKRIIEDEDAEEGASSSRLQPIIVFRNLEVVTLGYCPLLTSLFPIATEKEIMLPKLKSVWIESCEKLERIIEEEDAVEGASSSRLQPIIVFPNLEEVKLNDCPSLTSIFPVATEKEIMLPKLKSLTIYSCEKLKRIIEDEDAEEGASSSRLQPIIVFPNLEVVTLGYCPLLTSLFPIATEKEIMLPKLKSVWIESCEKLERTIKEDAEEGASSAVDMPCLEMLVVKRCPMMENFGIDAAAYGLRSAPKLKTLEVDGPIWDGEAIKNLFSGKFAK